MRIFGVQRFAGSKRKGVARGADDLILATDQIHFHAAMRCIPQGQVAEGFHVKIAAEFAIDS